MKTDMHREIETDKGTYLYATGILTSDIFGLIKNNAGQFVTPVYKVDEEGNIQTYMQKAGKPLPLYSFKFDGKQKTLKQPEMVGKTRVYCLLLKCEQGDGKKPVYYRIEAREEIAIEMNMFYRKGDRISVFAKKYRSTGIETGRSEDVWILQDVSKVKDSFVLKEELNYSEEYEE